MANRTKSDSQLTLCEREQFFSKAMPVSAEAAGRLRALLSQPILNLQAVTEAIQSDLELTLRLFQFAAQRPATVPCSAVDISEIVVHLGRQNLRAMICASQSSKPCIFSGAC